MNIRQWLGRARSINKELKALEAGKREALAAATRITQNYEADGAQTTKDPHKLDRLAGFIYLIDEKRDELLQTKAEIVGTIYKLTDGRQRTVLLEYYVNCLSWEEVSVKTHYSWRQTMYLRKAAISQLEKDCIDLHI